MAIEINSVTTPVATPPPATPVAPTTATSAQVASHNSLLQQAITDLEALPHSLKNDEQYLNLQAQTLTTWVSAKHMKTRLLEAIGITAAISSFLTFLALRFL